jgi:hypothetical protein
MTTAPPQSISPASQLSGTDPTDAVALWADARTAFFANAFPEYGSPAWRSLHPNDPARLASVLAAAEKWRKYGDEPGLLQWFREASQNRDALHRRRTLAELDQEWIRVRERAAAMWARERAALKPNPRWPKVAVPGQENRT